MEGTLVAASVVLRKLRIMRALQVRHLDQAAAPKHAHALWRGGGRRRGD